MIRFFKGKGMIDMKYMNPAPDGVVTRIEKEAFRIITDATPTKRRFKGKIHPSASMATPEVAAMLKQYA